MQSIKDNRAMGHVRRAMLTCVISAMPWATVNATPVDSTAQAAAAAAKQAVSAWHANLKVQGPPSTGCYRASYPSSTWTAEACGPAPTLVSLTPVNARNRTSALATASTGGPLNAGNGNDFAAETGNLTHAAVGTFPTVSGATSGTSDYSLQINTNNSDNPVTCEQFGYSSCQTWEQFIYATDSESNSAQAFIQNWFFAGDASEYGARGCPAGWNAYSSQNACYRNSDSVSVDYVPMTGIGGIALTGAANQDGRDVVTFTVNGAAHAASQDASTLNIGNIWRRSEFNIFGNGAGAPVASFNEGTHVDVRVAVDDGSSTAPTCLQRAGTTGEENNLTLGSCSASGGDSPAIQFDESH